MLASEFNRSIIAASVVVLCLFVSGHQATKAMTVNITVSDAPKLVELVEELNNPEDTNATITCSVGSGQLEGLSFEWYKDKTRLFSDVNKIRIEVLPGNYLSLLRIHQLKPSDAGTYSCIARNRFGNDKITTKLNVKVQLKWIAEPRNMEVPVGRQTHVACQADGSPSPRIEWRKLADSESDRLIIGPELRFSSVQQQDAGYYECRASNGVEEDLVSRIKIDVLGK